MIPTVEVTQVCSQESHTRMKRSTDEWAEGTTPIGTQYIADDVPPLHLANCNLCHSTLCRESRAKVIEHPVLARQRSRTESNR